jgi:hypothetical protein
MLLERGEPKNELWMCIKNSAKEISCGGRRRTIQETEIKLWPKAVYVVGKMNFLGYGIQK